MTGIEHRGALTNGHLENDTILNDIFEILLAFTRSSLRFEQIDNCLISSTQVTLPLVLVLSSSILGIALSGASHIATQPFSSPLTTSPASVTATLVKPNMKHTHKTQNF
jgi:hypothetical protein